ncbi:MAG: HDIG domain-containing protein [Candidatus Rokubacteria bacterium]|nr:HDIG domain-containing protein [Candidatus Rokubacteria bacterium]
MSKRLALTALDPRALPLLRAVVAAGAGRDAVLVGGAVRDACLTPPRRGTRDSPPATQPSTRPAVDVDVTVPRGAIDVARRVADRLSAAYLVLDEERGAARVIAGAGRLDVTDWRAPTLEEDLAARDFTVNALAVPLRTLLRDGGAPVIDPTGGLADLAAARLRPAGPTALADDPLRALRGVRLEATLGFRLTAAATRAVRVAAPGLTRVSAERQRDELLLLLGLPRAGRALRRLDALGLLGALVPDIEAMRRTAQPRPHRFDVLEHSLRAVDGADRLVTGLTKLGAIADDLRAHLAEEVGGGVDRAQLLRLATLLHDVSKPETRRLVDGRVRFFEHDLRGAARARAIGERLRLPGRAVASVERLVRHHLRPMHLAQSGEITSRARYRFFRDLADDSRDLLLLVTADAAAVTGISPFVAWKRGWVVRELMAGWQEQQDARAAPPLLRGEDVMTRFALPPGPAVGALLTRAREAQALGLVATREEALRYLDSSEDGP